MTSKVARCYEWSRGFSHFTRERCVANVAQKSAWELLLFGLQMALRRVKGSKR